MRLVKLVPELLRLTADRDSDEASLQAFFTEDLPGRNPPGLFPFPRGRIGDGGLARGETVLFSFQSKLRFVAKAGTGRIANIYMLQAECPHCFVIDLTSLRRADCPLRLVDEALSAEAGLQRSLLGQGWTKFPDTQRAEAIINRLICHRTETQNDAAAGAEQRFIGQMPDWPSTTSGSASPLTGPVGTALPDEPNFGAEGISCVQTQYTYQLGDPNDLNAGTFEMVSSSPFKYYLDTHGIVSTNWLVVREE